MVSMGTLLAFAGAAFLLVVIPGPSVVFIITRGVSLGRRAAVWTVLGHTVGLFTQVLAVAAGIGALVERSIVVYTAVKLVGAAYLVYLGVQGWRHRGDLDLAAVDADEAPRSPRRLMAEGYVVGLANPKAIVFFASILTQFVDPSRGPVPLQMVVLGLIAVLIALVSDGTWGVMAGTARRWLARSPRRLSLLRGTGGVVTVGLGLRLAVSRRAD